MCVSEGISQGFIVRLTHRAQPLGYAFSLPCPWSKELAIWNSLQRHEIEIGCGRVNSVTPPVQLLTATRVDNSEEDDHGCHGDTEVESKRKEVVVPRPPHVAVAAEVELEDEPNQCRRREVDACAGWHTRRTDPEDGNVDVAEKRSWVLAGKEIEGDWGNGPDE